LDSLKRLDFDELERQRLENAKKLKELEAKFWASRETSLAGKLMKQRLGFNKTETDAPSPPEGKADKYDNDELTFGDDKNNDSVDGKSRRRRRQNKDEAGSPENQIKSGKSGRRRPRTGKQRESSNEDL